MRIIAPPCRIYSCPNQRCGLGGLEVAVDAVISSGIFYHWPELYCVGCEYRVAVIEPDKEVSGDRVGGDSNQ
jgi:hypothetical protein